MFRKIGRLVFFVFFLNLHIHFPGCKLVCFSFVSATHFRFNLLLFFSPLFIFYCRLFCPGPSRLTFQNWVSRTETHRASRHVLSVMMMYKCVLERTGDTKRMSRLDFWICGFFDFFVVAYLFSHFRHLLLLFRFFSKVRFKRAASVIKQTILLWLTAAAAGWFIWIKWRIFSTVHL